jgi:hypothetical protein
MPKQYHNPGAESEGDPSGLPQRKARALGGPPHMKPTLEDADTIDSTNVSTGWTNVAC